MLKMIIRLLRVAAEALGLFDSCDTSAFRVRPARRPGGGLRVTSDADPGLQATELETLASTLRNDGYQVHLEAADHRPELVVEGLGKPRTPRAPHERPDRNISPDRTPTSSRAS
jgi:hypothetical protein